MAESVHEGPIRLSRRATLTALAGGGLAVAAGALGWRAADQGLFTAPEDRPGHQAWREWAEHRYAGPLALVCAGVLAASPHNTQPWRFHVTDRRIDLHAVPERHLGAFDPYRREMAIGLGCAVETMRLAAPTQGLAAVVAPRPDPADPTLFARLELSPGLRTPSPLVNAIGRRHTDRAPYDPSWPVPSGVLRRLAEQATSPVARLALFTRSSPRGRLFADATVAATAQIVGDEEMDAWSHRWMHHARAEVDRRRDGLTLAASGVSPLLHAVGEMLPDLSARQEGGYWLAATRDADLPTAAAFGVIQVADPYDPAQSLEAGGLWTRLQLAGTGMGLGMQPLNQIPEVIDRERQLGRPATMAARVAGLSDGAEWRPTFCFRLGYPTRPAPASPRRPVDEVVA